MKRNTLRKLCMAAGLAAIAVTSRAMPLDAQIVVDRALNSPTLTVRYSGAHATLVELKLNGESLGTRSVSGSHASGETDFTINPSDLKDGDNEIEIRLFDKTGKIVGSEKSNISTDQSQQGPVFLQIPKMGATVQGPVEISVGFNTHLKDQYVSFFVDNTFKAMTNYPPFTYLWDSEREANGWHEIEAWVIDSSSTTYKTRKTRVFVNNPGGHTYRPGASKNLDLSTSQAPFHASVFDKTAGVRPSSSANVHSVSKAATGGNAPRLHATTVANPVHASLTSLMAGTKPVAIAGPLSTGVQHMTPTGNRVAGLTLPTKPVRKTLLKTSVGEVQIVARNSVAIPVQGTSISNVSNALHLVPITRGQRIPNIGSFIVVYDSQFVNFDVQPRVDDGVPMTPFRYLFEKAGGKVSWTNMSKSVTAKADGHNVFLQIGDKTAKVNSTDISLEMAPYLERGRTIVPLSFMRDALNVDVEYDKATGHVLITSAKK